MPSSSRKQLEQWLGTIDVAADNVIDFGGSQNPVPKRVKSWKVGTYHIADLPKPHEEKEPANLIFDLNLPMNPPEDLLGKYDVAFCLEVMEYVWNPVLAMHNMGRFLKSGGKLHISFPFIYPVHEPKLDDCLRYTDMGAVKIMANTGFQDINITYRKADYDDVLQDFYRLEGMKKSKDFAYHGMTGLLITAIKK